MTGQPDWQNDMRRAFAGLDEAIAESMALVEAQKRRDGEDGYLPRHVAWECARVEYTWRRKHDAARKGKEQWKGYYKGAVAGGRKRYEDWERERGLRLTAEGDRDEYKARWEDRGRTLAQAWETAAKMADSLEKARLDLSDAATVRRDRDKARRDLENMRKDNVRLTTHAEALREALKEARARAHRIREANLRLCALREADRTGKDADDVPTGLRTSGVLITPRIRSEIRDVSRPGQGRNIGYLRPYALGWNAYVYRSRGTEEFVGWYKEADKAAQAIDRRYGRSATVEQSDFETTGALVARKEEKTVWDVIEGENVIGVVRDNGHGTYNAYVGAAETFVGVYKYADQAARAVRASS